MQALAENNIENRVAQFVQSANDLTVKNKTDLERVVLIGEGIKSFAQEIENELNPDIDKAHKLHKSLVAKRKKYLAPLEAVVDEIKANIKTYHAKIEAEQEELERLANEALAREAEKIKKELETKAVESDNEWDAEVLNEKASQVKAVTVDTVKPELTQGVSAAKRWKARIIDQTKVPEIYKIVNEKLLNEIATATKGRHSIIAGIEFYQETSIRL